MRVGASLKNFLKLGRQDISTPRGKAKHKETDSKPKIAGAQESFL
jgi:hypothetical protein